ncbi:GlxA family transcriptional regulator [Sphingosinicella microcystinivorans]|nr:DJ-1/PfpI family protein [Sphingosinicella microcystinivorans]BBE36012.1 AraC family transcriptional regulator [Sphingosinicella microcystinivorans]
MRTLLLAFPGFQLLDLSGPAAVFGAAAEALGNGHEVVTISAQGGPVVSSCGVAVVTVPLAASGAVDTLLVVGGDGSGLEALMEDRETGEWFRAAADEARRYGSICTGAFALAAWGLTRGRRVATHWRSAERLSQRFPETTVDADAMFVEDGALWTSAGVTAGIDMALAMVERDYGPRLANAIARRLVLSVRRPGNQSQYSPLLRAQAKAAGRYADLVGYIAANLGRKLDVEALSARVRETPRSFHRNFREATGKTPAAFVTAARLDRARTLLGEGAPVKAVAAVCGFSSPEHFTKSFSGAFGLSPAAWRSLHATASAPPRR